MSSGGNGDDIRQPNRHSRRNNPRVGRLTISTGCPRYDLPIGLERKIKTCGTLAGRYVPTGDSDNIRQIARNVGREAPRNDFSIIPKGQIIVESSSDRHYVGQA